MRELTGACIQMVMVGVIVAWVRVLVVFSTAVQKFRLRVKVWTGNYGTFKVSQLNPIPRFPF